MVVLLVLLTVAVAVGAYLLLRGKPREQRQLPSQRPSSGQPQLSGATKQRSASTAPKGKSESKLATEKPAQYPDDSSAVALESAKSAEVVSAAASASDEAAQEDRPSQVHDIVGLRRGLDKSRRADGFFGRIAALLRGKKEIDADIAAQVEEVLLTSDVGVQTTQITN